MARNMHSVILFAIVMLGIILICARGSNSTERIIVDMDGGIDDIQALVMLLNAESKGLVKIEAITCATGNTKLLNVGNNVFRLLETINRTDIPVYFGSYNTILPNKGNIQWYGSDGFGDLHYNKSVQTSPKEDLGIVAMKDLLTYNSKQISILCLGPLTNIGMLFRIYNNISNDVKELLVMGGNYLGNEAEFNFKSDPEAASIVLANAHCPLKLLTWEACSTVTVDLKWRFEIDIDNPVWNLIERAERALYTTDYMNDPHTLYSSCDGIVGMMYIDQHIITNSTKHGASVDLWNHTRGLVLIDDNKYNNNIEFITNISTENFKTVFVQNFIDICKNYECLKLF